jgi:GT2 family glycosyltransferase
MDISNLSVLITVVAFSDEETVRACLESLRKQKKESAHKNCILRVIVNNRSKLSVNSLKADFPDFEFAVPSRNLGYAGAIKNAWDDGCGDIIIVTNDDITFRTGWLDGILKPFGDEKVFATTCSIINQGEEEEKSNGTLNPIGIRIPDVFEDRTKVLYPSGAAFAFRRDDVPPVDPTYFLYYEDVYIGLLARMRGFNIVMNPDAKADHVNRASTSKIDTAYLHYLQERNRLANIYLFFSGVTLIRLIPYMLADFIIRIMQMITWKRRPDAVLRAWFYYLTHVGTTLSRRFRIAEHRKVRDSEILPFMSGKLLPDYGRFVNFLNRFFLWYAKIVDLKFAEINKHDSRTEDK